MHSTLKALPLVALAAVLLAGCGGSSILSGQGGSGGLGTPGTGTGDPNATLSFRLRGSTLGDFEASDIKSSVSIRGFQVQGSATAGPSTGRIFRVATVRFNGLPVAGQSYVIAANGDNGAVMQYTEKNQQTNLMKVWNGVSGTVHVGSVTSDHVDASFSAALDPAQNATTGISASAGEIHVKF